MSDPVTKEVEPVSHYSIVQVCTVSAVEKSFVVELVFTCKNKLNIVNSVLFLIKGVYNGKKSANTLLFRE